MKSTLLALCLVLAGCASTPSLPVGKQQAAAERMIRTSETTLAPVYAPLAEHLVAELALAAKTGIGIDLGSGPGTLIVELCPLTPGMHWINADINPHFFAYFYRLAERHGVAHQVSAVFADAQDMPFRDNYADVVVSRGTYHFWPDRKAGFREIHRILKPGGVAYIGRGFSPNLPAETARAIRDAQRGMWDYDLPAKVEAMGEMLREIGIHEFRIHTPQPPGSEGIGYGLWVEFRKAGQ